MKIGTSAGLWEVLEKTLEFQLLRQSRLLQTETA